MNEGRADYVPVFLSDVPRAVPDRRAAARCGDHQRDATRCAWVLLPGHLGRRSAGRRSLGEDRHRAAERRGASHARRQLRVHVSEIDLGVEVDQRPYEHIEPEIGDVERRIGELVAELVPDEATIQMGIGSIPGAVRLALRGKRDLGAHTELFTDVVLDLVEAGALTGAAKEINRGKIVTTFLMGSRRLYDFVNDNPMVEMRPVDYTNDTSVIRRFRRMVAINSAIAVDLTGQVSADSIGTRFYSGVGGQMDFMRGAALAAEGRAIIALPSTADAGRNLENLPCAPRGCRRGDQSRARSHRRDGIRRGGALRAQRPRAGPCADRNRPPGFQRRAPPLGTEPIPPGHVKQWKPRPAGAMGSDDWIVCQQMTLDVVERAVLCPMGGMADVADCRSCRFLQSLPHEWRWWGSDKR